MPLETINLPLRAVICDTDPGSSQWLYDALRQYDGATALVCADSAMAIEFTRNNQATVLFVDPLSLPNGCSADFIHSFRNDQPAVPVVLYADVARLQASLPDFSFAEGSRFSHYFRMDKRTPISEAYDALHQVLRRCVQYIGERWSKTELEALAARAKGHYSQLFISYSHADTAFVTRLVTALREAGITDIWIDFERVSIGQSLSAIGSALDQARFVAVILSSQSIASPWVQREIEVALARELRSDSVVLLPIVLDDCEIPPFLRMKKTLRFSNEADFAANLRKLVSGLRT